MQGLPQALSQIQLEGVENQAECLKFWKKNSRAPAGP